MSNYLTEIESEYSRGRGKSSRLAPMDWQLADQWEKDGIPLRIALAAMTEGFKKYADKNNGKGEISSLRYFIPMVNKQFAEWKTSQVGKAPEPETTIFRKTDFEEKDMKGSTVVAFAVQSENVAILDGIATNLMQESFERQNISLPEPLSSAVVKLRGEILALLDDAALKQISIDEIEKRLAALKVDFEVHLIVSISEEERQRIITETKTEYGKFHLMPDLEHKVLIRKLYRRFGLPELTLFAL